MTDKATIRAEFAQQLVQADMTQIELEEYLSSDMTKSPAEFMAEGEVSQEEFAEYLDDKFPKGKEV